MNVKSLMVHSGEMNFLDEIVTFKDNFIHLKCTIKETNLFLVDGKLPKYTFVEFMAQGASALSGIWNKNIGKKPEIGFLIGIRDYYMYKDYISIGSEIHVKVTNFLRDESGFGTYDCELYEEDFLVSKVRLSGYSENKGVI